jgi:hypothetical protein
MIDLLQRHHPIRQQPQGPTTATFRGLAASQNNHVRFCVSIQLPLILAARLVAFQRGFQSFFHEHLPHALDRRAPDLQPLGDGVIVPCRFAGVGVRLQKNSRMRQLSGGRLAPRKHRLQHPTFFLRQSHDILLLHVRPPCLGYAYPIGKENSTYPSIDG